MSFQEPPTQPPPPSAPSLPGIDIGGLVDGIVNGFHDVLTSWVQELPQQIADGINDSIGSLWNGLWASGANLFATPFALTVDFGPARMLGVNAFALVYGITTIAVVLLALRNLWMVMGGGGGAVHDAVYGLLIGILLAGSGTMIVAEAFMLTGLASDAVGRIDYRPALQTHSLLTVGPDFLLGAFTLIVLLFYGWKLMVRAAYRIVLLAFLAPLAPVFSIFWAIPQLRWVASWYWSTLGNWLAGGVLAIAALSLGVQIALVGGGNAMLSLIFGVALIQIAHDLMPGLSRGSGSLNVGSPFSAVLGAAGVASAVASGGTTAAAAASSSGAGSAVAGALPSGDDHTGYGY